MASPALLLLLRNITSSLIDSRVVTVDAGGYKCIYVAFKVAIPFDSNETLFKS